MPLFHWMGKIKTEGPGGTDFSVKWNGGCSPTRNTGTPNRFSFTKSSNKKNNNHHKKCNSFTTKNSKITKKVARLRKVQTKGAWASCPPGGACGRDSHPCSSPQPSSPEACLSSRQASSSHDECAPKNHPGQGAGAESTRTHAHAFPQKSYPRRSRFCARVPQPRHHPPLPRRPWL